MSSQQRQAEIVSEEHPDPKYGPINEESTSPPQDKLRDIEIAEESDKYIIVQRYLEDKAAVILHLVEVLEKVSIHQKDEKDPQKLCQLIDQQTTLEQHIERLEVECDSIRWQVVSRNAILVFSDSVAKRLLDVQGQIGQVVGALSTVGAGLSFSLLFSATRGDLAFIFGAWWMFLIALMVTGGLGMTAFRHDDITKRPSLSEWTSRRWILLGIVISVLGVVGGFLSFALAALRLDMTSEVATGKPKITGPRPGPFGTHPVQDSLSIIIFVGFLFLFLAGFLRALQPSLRLTNMKARRRRQRWMLDPSRSGHPAKAKTLRDLWSENR